MNEILKQLQALCNAPLPNDYAVLLQQYPASLVDMQRSEDGAADEGTIAQVELLKELEDVLDLNREARATSIMDPDGEDFIWPEQLLLIGENGDGDYFCLDASGEYEGVLQFRHLTVEFELIAESLNEFVEMLLEAFDGE